MQSPLTVGVVPRGVCRDQELHQLRLKRQGMARYKRRPHNNNNHNDAAATATAPATVSVKGVVVLMVKLCTITRLTGRLTSLFG